MRLSVTHKITEKLITPNVHTVRKLYENGNNLEVLYEMIAEYEKLAPLLLELGVDLNKCVGVAPLLYHTVSHGDMKIAELLISLGADINTKGMGRCLETPLHQALYKCHSDIVKMLISRGADVFAIDNSKYTSLFYARTVDDAELLLSLGVDVNATDTNGESALIHILAYHTTDLAKLLISRGADVHMKTNNSVTPLHVAAGCGNVVIVELLLSLGVDVNLLDAENKTPLDRAIEFEHDEVANILRSYGGYTNIEGNSEESYHYPY